MRPGRVRSPDDQRSRPGRARGGSPGGDPVAPSSPPSRTGFSPMPCPGARAETTRSSGVADAVGATLVIDPSGGWSQGARAAKRDWLLCLADGDVPTEGWIRALDRFIALSPPDRLFGRLRRPRQPRRPRPDPGGARRRARRRPRPPLAAPRAAPPGAAAARRRRDRARPGLRLGPVVAGVSGALWRPPSRRSFGSSSG